MAKMSLFLSRAVKDSEGKSIKAQLDKQENSYQVQTFSIFIKSSRHLMVFARDVSVRSVFYSEAMFFTLVADARIRAYLWNFAAEDGISHSRAKPQFLIIRNTNKERRQGGTSNNGKFLSSKRTLSRCSLLRPGYV